VPPYQEEAFNYLFIQLGPIRLVQTLLAPFLPTRLNPATHHLDCEKGTMQRILHDYRERNVSSFLSQ